MSFTALEVLEEFAEASRYGRRNETDRLAAKLETWWWKAEGRRVTRRSFAKMTPCLVRRERCGACGGEIEIRQGAESRVHLGGSCRGQQDPVLTRTIDWAAIEAGARGIA